MIPIEHAIRAYMARVRWLKQVSEFALLGSLFGMLALPISWIGGPAVRPLVYTLLGINVIAGLAMIYAAVLHSHLRRSPLFVLTKISRSLHDRKDE